MDIKLAASIKAANRNEPVLINVFKTAILATNPDQGGIPANASHPEDQARAAGKLA